MPHQPVYGLDIETGHPASGCDEALPAAGTRHPTGEVPAVDPRHTVVVRAVLSTAAREWSFTGDEPTLLGALDSTLGGLEPGIVATWNGSSFDLPFLADRAGIRGVHLGLRLAADPRWRRRGEVLPGHRYPYRAAWYAHRHLDAARLYRSGRRPLVEVDELLRAVGLPAWGRGTRGTGPADAPGEELTHDALHAFASNDARLVRSLVEARLPGVNRFVDRITVTTPVASPPVASVPASRPGRTLVGRISLSPAHPAVRAALSVDPG